MKKLALFLVLLFCLVSVNALGPWNRLIEKNQTGFITPSPYAVWYNGTAFNSNCDIWRSFDNSTFGGAACGAVGQGDVVMNERPGIFVGFDLGPGNDTVLNSFNLTFANYNSSRQFDPTSFIVSGSADNSSYTVLGTAAYGGINTTNAAGRTIQLNFTNLVKYRYYRWQVNGNAGGNSTITQWSEIMPLRDTSISLSNPYLTINVNDTRSVVNVASFTYTYNTTNASDPGPFTRVVTNTSWPLTNYTGTLTINFTNVSNSLYFNTSLQNYVFSIVGTATGLTWQNYLNLSLNNTVNLSTIRTFSANVSNGTATWSGNTVNNTIIFYNVIGDLSILYWNISQNTYFNVTYNNSGFNTSQNVTNNTYQAYLNISAYRLYLNTSITSFNTTNWGGLANLTNTTTNGYVVVLANTGSTTIQVDVGGNYSQNYTCTVSTPLVVTYCNATGIYDNRFTIGANSNGVGISTFSVNVSNTTLGIPVTTSISTTNGSAVFSLLQGYIYQFFMNAPTYAFANTSQTPIAATSLYNFSLQTNNTFNVTFLDETTGARIMETITLEVISASFAQNYTIYNGTGNVSFLTPNDYTLRYHSLNYEQRDYYVTLNNQQYLNFTLYDINATSASQVIVTVTDTGNARLENATVTLLRYFVSCNCYNIVQMERTSYSGNAIFWVQANIGYYKWSVDYQGANYFLSTTPEQIATSTRNFILNLGNNWYAGYTASSTVASLLSFNRNTGAITFTWSDPTGTITGACLYTEYTNMSTTYRNQTCSTGISGSLLQTLAHANTTTYRYKATINTSTTTPELILYSGTVEALATTSVWGNLGIFLALAILMTITLLFSVSPIMVIIANGLGMIIISALGIMPFTSTFIVGLVVTIIGLAAGAMRR